MGNPGESSPRMAFGEFEVDLRTREVWTNGRKFDLQEQPFQVLCALLDRPTQLVTREELTKRLWSADTFVDYEHALNRVIKRLREALNDSANEPRFIETLPRRGYRFIAPVRQVGPSDQSAKSVSPMSPDISDTATAHRESDEVAQTKRASEFTNLGHFATDVLRPWYRVAGFVAIAATLGCLAGWITYRSLFLVSTLRVVRSRQLTTASKIDAWGGLTTDGARLYFVERQGDHWNLAQTSVSGGDSQLVPAPFQNTRILDVSPDRSSLLIGSFAAREALMPIWIWPVQGGAPKRIGGVYAYDARWHPNGHQILYGQDGAIYQVDVDGSNAHRFVDVNGRPGFFSWSPDGRELRFTVFSGHPSSSTIWQVDSDGRGLRRLLPERDHPLSECCGLFSPDGQYFFFHTWGANAGDIWVRREKVGWFQRHPSATERITFGPIPFALPVPSADGHRLFVLGETATNELVRYDLQSHQFTPFLPDLSIFSLAFSRDGQWIVYRHSRDSALARVKLDGSQPLALSGAELRWGTTPVWSPDGRQIAFTGQEPGHLTAVFLISTEGGAPKQLFVESENQDEPTWSPDGKFLAFSRSKGPDNPQKDLNSIGVFDFATGKASPLPASVGLRAPSWSPYGGMIAAFTADLHKLMLLDRPTGKWTELAAGTLLGGPLSWSNNEKYLYYQDLLAPNQPIYRIRLSDRKIELVTTLESFLHGGIHRAGFQGLAPDGSLIVRLDRGDNDVYALDLDVR